MYVCVCVALICSPPPPPLSPPFVVHPTTTCRLPGQGKRGRGAGGRARRGKGPLESCCSLAACCPTTAGTIVGPKRAIDPALRMDYSREESPPSWGLNLAVLGANNQSVRPNALLLLLLLVVRVRARVALLWRAIFAIISTSASDDFPLAASSNSALPRFGSALLPQQSTFIMLVVAP